MDHSEQREPQSGKRLHGLSGAPTERQAEEPVQPSLENAQLPRRPVRMADDRVVKSGGMTAYDLLAEAERGGRGNQPGETTTSCFERRMLQ